MSRNRLKISLDQDEKDKIEDLRKIFGRVSKSGTMRMALDAAWQVLVREGRKVEIKK